MVSFKSPADTPAKPGMLRKSTAFVPRYQKFESISLQQTVRLSPDFAFVPGKARVFRQCGDEARRHGRQRRASSSNIALRNATVSVGRNFSTAVSPTRFTTVGPRRQARLAARASAISIKLIAGICSSKAQHDPLIVPSQRQTRVYEQLVCGQIGRLAPVENGLRDVRGEIALWNVTRSMRPARTSWFEESGRGCSPTFTKCRARLRSIICISLYLI